jgi:hypothetical protein
MKSSGHGSNNVAKQAKLQCVASRCFSVSPAVFVPLLPTLEAKLQ